MADLKAQRGGDLTEWRFRPCEKLNRYVGDITYIMTWEDWACLARVIDLASS